MASTEEDNAVLATRVREMESKLEMAKNSLQQLAQQVEEMDASQGNSTVRLQLLEIMHNL